MMFGQAHDLFTLNPSAVKLTVVDVNPQKQRKGLSRLFHAFGYSLSGLYAAWFEKAFRQEVIAALVLIPCAFWLGNTWLEIAMLVSVVVLVMVVELLNTGIESAIDRIGPEWHQLAKRAKDIGSAAVFLSLMLCLGVWCAALWTNVLAF
jgi:diacylglycerol kinase (ATP)